MCPVRNYDVDGSDNFKFKSDHSVEEAIERFFRLGGVRVLSELKTMAPHFRMKLNFVIVRCGRKIPCNRANRYGNRKSLGIRNVPSISCGCD